MRSYGWRSGPEHTGHPGEGAGQVVAAGEERAAAAAGEERVEEVRHQLRRHLQHGAQPVAAQAVHRAGVSMIHRTVPETQVDDDDWEDHIIEEPV